MKLLNAILIIASLAANVQARWKPTPGLTWNYVLGSKVDISSEKAQVLDVDYESTSASTIQKYHNAGKKVICYFSGGTLEKFRDDFNDYKKVSGLVKNVYDDWSDEFWLDFRVSGIKRLIEKRMDIAVSKKCDAIEVDNLDGYQMDEVKSWSNPLTAADTVAFAKWLGTAAHNRGISIGLKNVVGLIGKVGSYFDFAINESCIHYKKECALYSSFVKSNKAVFGVTYGNFNSVSSKICSEINNVGISMIVKASQSLSQSSTIFNGKQVCGNSFNTGFPVGLASVPNEEKPKTTKTTNKTTKTIGNVANTITSNVANTITSNVTSTITSNVTNTYTSNVGNNTIIEGVKTNTSVTNNNNNIASNGNSLFFSHLSSIVLSIILVAALF